MEIIKKIIKLGNSLSITLPKEINNKVIKGDICLFSIDLMKIIKRENKIIHYKCSACEHHFHNDDIEPYCPICNNESLIIIKQKGVKNKNGRNSKNN